MRLQLKKLATFSSQNILQKDTYHVYVFGWYKSGKACIAKDGVILSYKQAFQELVPSDCFQLCDSFFISTARYNKSLDGIVRYLQDKFKK